MLGLLINILFFSVGAKFLTLGIGAREIAMGSIGSVLVRDANATYFNPALLSFVKVGNLSTMHSDYLLDMRMESFSLSHPFGKIFTGLNFYGLFVSELEGRTGPSETFTPFSASFLNTSFSSSALLFRNLSVGVTFKNVYERIDTFSSSSFAFDMGFVYQPEKSYFEIGGVISNIGGKLRLKSENFELPSSFKIGTGFYYRNIKFAIEIFKIFKENTEFKIGGEYTIKEILSIRGGYITGYSQTSSLAGFATGFGIKYRNFNFDYAFQPYGDLGNVHRVSVGFAFAPLRIKLPERKKIQEPKIEKEKIVRKGLMEKTIFNLDSLYTLALQEFNNKNLFLSLELFFKIVYIRDDFKEALKYFDTIKEELIKSKIEFVMKEYKKELDRENLLDAYAVLRKSYDNLKNEILSNKMVEIENSIIRKSRLNKTESEILKNALVFYSYKEYKKALSEFKKISNNTVINNFISVCEEKRERLIGSLKRDLEFYLRNENFEKAYRVIKKLEEEGYYSPEFMVTKARVEKKLEQKSLSFLEQAKIYKKSGNYIDALILISRIEELYSIKEAEELEKEILDNFKNNKELYEKLMEKAILLFSEGKTDDALLLWKKAEKIGIKDKRLEYVKILQDLS